MSVCHVIYVIYTDCCLFLVAQGIRGLDESFFPLLPNLSFSPGTRIQISCLINTCTIYHSLYSKQTGSKSYRFSAHPTKYLQTKDLYEPAGHYRNYVYPQCDEYRGNVPFYRSDINGTKLQVCQSRWSSFLRHELSFPTPGSLVRIELETWLFVWVYSVLTPWF